MMLNKLNRTFNQISLTQLLLQISFIFVTTLKMDQSQQSEQFEAIKQTSFKYFSQNPSEFFKSRIFNHSDTTIVKQKDKIKMTKLYQIFETMPKGVMHHLHIQCNPDVEFMKQVIIKDPNIYVDQQRKKFKIGTKQQAKLRNWVSFQEMRKLFVKQEQFQQAVYEMVSLTKEQIDQTKIIWQLFQSKIIVFLDLLCIEHIYRAYFEHVFRKFIKNGYQRLQFRSILPILRQYDGAGNLVKQNAVSHVQNIIDAVYQKVKKEYEWFSIGVIASTLKRSPKQLQSSYFSQVYKMNWDKLIGVDFVNQEDPNGQLGQYDQIICKIQKDYPDNKLKRFYHAGESRNAQNNNIEIAMKAGCRRFGHGINIVFKQDLLRQIVEHKTEPVCFQICPISNLVLGYVDDFTKGVAGTLMKLNVPFTINPDDPGIFGYENSTLDFVVSTLSHDWNINDLRKLGLNSIKHSAASEQKKKQMLLHFAKQWNQWAKISFK